MKVIDLAIKTPSFPVDTPIWKLANIFKRNVVNWLPVILKNQNLGLVEATRVRKSSVEADVSLLKLEDIVERMPLIINEYEDSNVALKLFEKFGSNVAIVLSNGRVFGIVTRDSCLLKSSVK